MAQVEGLNARGTRWYVRIVIPDDLRGAYGKARVNLALGTSDRKEAVLRGTLTRAEWLADFEAKRASLKPTRIDAITPDLAAHLAAMVRVHVLGNDDRVRSDVKLLAEMVHIRHELRLRAANPLRIPQWEPTEVREDDLSGLTPEEAHELADLNAYLDGQAAIALAGQNLKAVMPLVEAQAARLGFAFDAKTPGVREALIACLRAFRTAHRELTLRDAGEVVETPVVPPRPSSAATTSADKPKTLRDVFDRWKQSGARPRSEDSVQAMDRALRQFEGQHPGETLASIKRELGLDYRAWLMENCRTPKTARDRLTGLKTLLKFAFQELEWTERHAWVGLDIEAKTTNKRRAIRDDEMAALFGSPLHTRYELPKAANAGRDAAYWVPLIGAFTGARLGEVCQLRTADVQTVDGIPALVITDEGDGQTVKTDAGHRTIPIHSELLRLGFLGYVEATQKAGHDSLWPALPLRKVRASDYFGRWFKEFREGIGMVEAGQPSFHYFRHSVRPLMRRAGVDARIRDLILGHETKGSVGDVVYDGVLLEELKPGVEAIRYPALALPVVSPHANR
ncbi:MULTISPECIES: site-specific integrase [Hydrogenophaga]|uniref:Phage integrase family protein n=1 Tax=Hydrogenophaga intermedia TaxID=65786 RepID=A0A1L1PFL3_HYDIT|nr:MULTISPECIES: site-specific integrase [Hydrogenophaga]AOS78899.1 hypothetical protein Q5W_07980 [Hydrogenophaga sp. PBC]TMU74429.1 site-specific integrase [Hydrogenophaga intermedia]CDN88768.1 Phage integrase family protein [Hydrogenophaga intermedia]